MTERFGEDRKRVAQARRGARSRSRRGSSAASASWRSAARRATSPRRTRSCAASRRSACRATSSRATRSPSSSARSPSASRRSAAKLRGIKPERGDIILAGALTILDACSTSASFDGVEVTEAGLREGVFFSRWLERRRSCFDDVRRQSVLNLAGLYHVDHAHTEHVARLALGMFDELAAAGLHDGDPVERELLWAACVLHDIGMTVDYDDHHKHSRYLILNGGLPGLHPARGRADRPGRALPPQGHAVASARSAR